MKGTTPTSVRIANENMAYVETIMVADKITMGKVVNDAIRYYYDFRNEVQEEINKIKKETKSNIVYKEIEKINRGVK